ncbi:unnamed protein product [Camellia sinensis]|uniref:VQ domain-containing protein n=1 Tax=Camellia sinensis var. sinensis TaxID=542762 RepID=A0A4S4EJ52_CAMSN|nr:protein MKS1-like [Camellia sinensis]THG16084.1 hypothetical protein TEA_014806 [Camellia sinensis var. sinensis]
MDQPDFNSGKSPRRELQGPRPTPLKVRKDSHKIRKPPVAPQQQPSQPPQPHHHHHHHHQTHPRIIYTVSPKVIHTDPSEFMTLVQRLTGSSSTTTCSSSSITSSSSYFSDHANGAISPAARFASTEKTKSPEKKKQQHQQQQEESSDMGMIEGVEISTEVERTGFFPGILSPGPAALPPIPANFFSPPSDPNPMSFLYDFSPVLQGNNKNYLEGSSSFMMPSPSFFLSPHITSPTTPSLDIFNNFFDFQF